MATSCQYVLLHHISFDNYYFWFLFFQYYFRSSQASFEVFCSRDNTGHSGRYQLVSTWMRTGIQHKDQLSLPSLRGM